MTGESIQRLFSFRLSIVEFMLIVLTTESSEHNFFLRSVTKFRQVSVASRQNHLKHNRTFR